MSTKFLLRAAKEAFDWNSYVEDHYEILHTNAEYECRICCPKCGDRKFKCYINTDKGIFNCFKCDFHTGKNHDVVSFIAVTENITKTAALLKLLDAYGPKAKSSQEMDEWVDGLQKVPLVSTGAPLRASYPEGTRNLSYTPNDPVWAYASSRGLTKEELEAASAKGVYDSYLYGTRLLFPVFAGDAELVSWQARSVDPKAAAKYVSAPHSKLAKVVWPNVRAKDGVGVLVEGVIDNLSMRRVSGVNAYATFGKHVSKEQCTALSNLGVRDITLWYDKSDAKREMIKAVSLLRDYMSKVRVVSFEGWDAEKDVGDLLLSPRQDAISSITRQLNSAIDCTSLDYAKWCLD